MKVMDYEFQGCTVHLCIPSETMELDRQNLETLLTEMCEQYTREVLYNGNEEC